MKITPLCLLLVLVSLALTSNMLQVFKYDPLTLYCKEQDGNSSSSSGWSVGRSVITSRRVNWCGVDWGELEGSYCTIKRALPHDSGLYWCQSEAGEKSEAVHVSVTCGYVVLESPVLPVNEGDEVNLRCWYYRTPTSFPASFYKDGALIGTAAAGHMTIPYASKSDEGLYKCNVASLGESPESLLAVREPVVSVGRVICHLVVISLFCISTSLMVRICRRDLGGPVLSPSKGTALVGRGEQVLDDDGSDHVFAGVAVEHSF
ncbi:low affinity immunoglobulin gamma Fc region receptor III-like isoform X2 [Lampris incognitus]|uniref:low affinity immunoglobulin gamma Fc region receptor III-like isoform X2 n=1 Tax=Lampris incognitus TaxID=2546036 RepID=UPI0024B4A297|nr:low affinity immunoglobulin gamma Fc region receptor III-like isoform X2 [Lampris incognitus]